MEEMQRCQRCGVLAWDWLCWDHWEQYCAEAEKAEAERDAELRHAEAYDRFMDAQDRKAEASARRQGWF
jgi:hypothetical protein